MLGMVSNEAKEENWGRSSLPFWKNVDDLPAHDQRRVVKNVGNLDVVLGDGEFAVVKDADEAEDPSLPWKLFSVSFVQLAAIPGDRVRTPTLNMSIQSKMA